ncbi:helix-turn-helix transcriptional regulator [Peteryoungia desertarenae]|uniref:Helix-turn-helix transcriptional regulator n=1 Tax=Peteryoungia desertarenae TaxID=1813451 RepID=A0ABX6QLU8_9HYPH|nr:helix-turn-helix transcriptional regulator [Peteryoungia desertarenae]QLF69247.1 helix-turn-helix transcriptional regulator [Peteryoungia desertarenae]
MNVLFGAPTRQRFRKLSALETLVISALEQSPEADYAVLDPQHFKQSSKSTMREPIECCSRPDRVIPVIRLACADSEIMAAAEALAQQDQSRHVPLMLQIGDHWTLTISFEAEGSDQVWFLLLMSRDLQELLKLFQRLQDKLGELDRPAPPRKGSLAPREIDVARWLCEGKTSAEIGDLLGIKEHTVNDYIKTATQKLGVSNRVHFVATAMRLGLIS